MVTVCELKVYFKSQGIKGYSKLNKAQMMALLARQRQGRPPAAPAAPLPRQARPPPPPPVRRSARVGRRPFLYGTGRNPYD